MELTGKPLEISLSLNDRKADKTLILPNQSLQTDGAYDFAKATSPQEQFLTLSSASGCPAAELGR